MEVALEVARRAVSLSGRFIQSAAVGWAVDLVPAAGRTDTTTLQLWFSAVESELGLACFGLCSARKWNR